MQRNAYIVLLAGLVGCVERPTEPTGVAQAQTAASLGLSPISGPPGTKLTVTGSGFGASEEVSIDFAGEPVGTAVAGASGSFSASVTVPTLAMPGSQTVTADGDGGGLASASFLVRTSWAQWHNDAARTGANLTENILTWHVVEAGLVAAWTKSYTRYIFGYSSPAVATGRVYIGATDGTLHAFRASDGSHRWISKGDSAFLSGPVAARQHVYATTQDGTIYAVDYRDGAVRWTARDPRNGVTFFASPVVNRGILFQTFQSGTVAAYNADGCGAATCPALWYGNSGGRISGRTSAAAVGDRVYVTGGDDISAGKLIAFDSKVCAARADRHTTPCPPLWSVSVAGITPSSPVVSGGKVFLDSNNDESVGWTEARSATTGALVWRTEHTPGSGFIRATPAVAYRRVFVGTGTEGFEPGASGTLFALDEDTGGNVWRGELSNGATHPVVAGGVVYAATFHGNVYAFGVGCGEVDGPVCTPLWESDIHDDLLLGSPAIADGTLFVATGALRAYRAAP